MINKKIFFSLAIAAASLSGINATAATPVGLLGSVTTSESATRAMSIESTTPYINVSYGDVVRFDASGKVFTIKFDGVRGSFDLNELAPAGTLAHKVRVYVSPVREDDLH